MLDAREKKLSNFILIFIFFIIILFFIFLQFLSPTLYEVDGYYHIAVSNFIKNFGPHYQFHWAQISTFKNSFSDKEFLFHLSIIPFLFLTNNIILAAKFAVIFYNILFFLVYIYILKKYLPNFLVACFLLLPILSSAFVVYSLWLRPAVLANILTILGIYFLINKRWVGLFIIALLYPLSHISFFMLIVFALICEIIRWMFSKEIFLKNIYIVILGCILGCLIHPNFPNNLLSFYLNAVLVPFYSIMNKGVLLGSEVYSSSARFIFVNNFAIFFTLNIILCMTLINRIKISFSTLVWWGCTSIYLIFAFISDKNWYISNVLFFIFFASYLLDWIAEQEWNQVLQKIKKLFTVYGTIIIFFIPSNITVLKNCIGKDIRVNTHYENVASWMRYHIPKGETVYHANGSDSPYFLCLNPNNNYLLFLDPIYMFYRSPEVYAVYINLREGKIDKPYESLEKVFNVRYGYTRKNNLLYYQIKSDPVHFYISYEDELGIIFEVLTT